MHVVIEALGARVGGGITRLLGVVEALPRVAPQHRYSIVLAPAYQQSVIDALPPQIAVIAARVGAGNLIGRAYFQNVTLPRIARRIGADVVFAAGEGAFWHAPLPLVMISGNLWHFRRVTEQWKVFAMLYRLARRPFLMRSFRVASRVAFVSNTIRDIATAEVNMPPDKAVVVHHGVDSRFRPRPEEPADPYYLAVSSIGPHKGYEDLLEAWSSLSGSPRLMVAGGVSDPPTSTRLQLQLRQLRLQSRVEFLGAVAMERMPSLYHGARALVFPSKLESFGLPLVEAMASGVPVIASDLPICREVCGNAALYFTAGDSTALAAAIQQMDVDSKLRSSLVSQGLARATQFTWENAASDLVNALEASCR